MQKLWLPGVSVLALAAGIPGLAQAKAQPAGAAASALQPAQQASPDVAAATPQGAQQTPPDTAGQPDASGTSVSEIIVTAAKRPQTLQSVPISVSVTSQATVERAQIRDLIDLQSVVPSLKVTQFNAVGQTNFIIRGFGNGNGNDGIESSVGVFIDGVYRSRSFSAIDDLPNVQRIEVLRGPQSTLFGKNVSAGAISIVTRPPQFTFGGQAEVSFGNFGLIQSRGTVTGPISDTLALSLFASNNQRDGYLRNQTTGSKVNDRDRQALRADLLWKPTSDLSVRIIADYNRLHEKCCGVVSIQNGPATQFIGAPRPFGLGRPVGDPTRIFDDTIIFNTDPTNDLSGAGLSGQVDYNAGFATLTSITAYRRQINKSLQDVDFTGADLSNKDERSDVRTFTQELRLTSKGSGPFSWLIGGFYEDEKLHSGRSTTYGPDIRGYIDGLSGRVPATLVGALPAALRPALTGQSNVYALEFLQSLVTPSIRPGATYFQTGQGISDFYALDQTSYSLFGQADYKITSRLTVTGGLAYLSDRKRAVSNVVLSDAFSQLNLQNVPQFTALGLPKNLYGPLGGLQFFYGNTPNHAPVNFPNANESGVLKGDKVTYTARAAYDFGPVNAYVSYGTGWKAGAYNLSSDSRPPDVNGVGRTAAPENVTVYEVGLKTRFHGGFVDVAIFDQAIKNFQSNLYTGTGYALVNAGKESVRGFEVDSAYNPLRWLALTGAVTYLDPKYDSFVQAPCFGYDTVRCPINPATGLTPNFRDLSGAKPAGIPKWSASVSATITHDFGSGNGAYLRGEYDYTSKYQLSETTPPGISTYGASDLNASLGFTNDRQQIEVMLWGRNLADHRALIATFPTVAQAGSYSAFVNQPRTYGVTLRKRF